MTASRTNRHRRLSLLIAALLLLSNALVTAHAFGEVDHAVKDGCQVLHQFERQQSAPVANFVQALDCTRHAAPSAENAICIPVAAVRHFQPRAPPLV
ncbi:MAG TPA: hypothetical protein VF254_02105 [Gammaproteobacteria bacterium]